MVAGGACNSNSTVCNKFTQHFSSALASFIQLQQFRKNYSGPSQGCCDDFGAIEAAFGVAHTVEIQREVFGCRVGDDADSVEREIPFLGFSCHGGCFHLDRVGAGLTKFKFFGRGGRDAIYGEELAGFVFAGCGYGGAFVDASDDRSLTVAAQKVVGGEDELVGYKDVARLQRGIQGPAKTSACQSC